jgi:hypothetical protein
VEIKVLSGVAEQATHLMFILLALDGSRLETSAISATTASVRVVA